MFKDNTLDGFTKVLGDKVSVPGGGGAAALVGALAAALGSMAANFTIGKKKYAMYEDDLKDILANTAKLRQKLLDFIDEDAKAFEPLSKAYAIPKDDPSKTEALEAATMNAIYPPLDIMDACADVLEVLDELVEKSSQIMLSDVGCAAILAGAALRAASLNVYVNTAALNDRAKAEELELTAERLLDDYLPLADVIAETVFDEIRSNEKD